MFKGNISDHWVHCFFVHCIPTISKHVSQANPNIVNSGNRMLDKQLCDIVIWWCFHFPSKESDILVILNSSARFQKWRFYFSIFWTLATFHKFSVQSLYVTIFRGFFFVKSLNLTYDSSSINNASGSGSTHNRIPSREPILNCNFQHFVSNSLSQKHVICFHSF